MKGVSIIMKTLQDYSKELRGGYDCARQGRSFTNYNPMGDDPAHFLQLREAERTELLDWIERRMLPRKYMNYRHTSYGLKHIYQHESGNYVSNGQFKGAMITAGFVPDDAEALNPSYAIRKVK